MENKGVTKSPNFLIVGAAKSGTTSLYFHLKSHPNVFMPERKELNFWYTGGDSKWAIMKRWPELPKSHAEYLEHFEEAEEGQVLGEASPGYLVYYKETAENIKKYHPFPDDLKIIIILREPIDKIWSHYKMVKRANMDPQNLSLYQSLKREETRKQDSSLLLDVLPVFSTSYYEQVKYYQDHFTHVKVVLYDDLKENPKQLLNELYKFIGVPYFEPEQLGKKINAAPKSEMRYRPVMRKGVGQFAKYVPAGVKRLINKTLVKEEKLDKRSKRLLVTKFRKEIVELNKIVEQDITPWLKKYEDNE